MQIKLTPNQLTAAQLGGVAQLNTGEIMTAVHLEDGKWKYLIAFDGVIHFVCYAGAGLDAAQAALDSVIEESTDD